MSSAKNQHNRAGRDKGRRETGSRDETNGSLASTNSRPGVGGLSGLLTERVWPHAFLGAVLFWASFPPVGLSFLGWVAPVPWVLLVRRESLGGRRPYGVLWLAGFATWLGTLHFLRLPHWATSFGWLTLSGYFAFYAPVFVGLSRVAVHRLRIPVMVAAPVVWTGLELARGHLLTGMTMACLGHTQYGWIDLIQISDLGGAYAVSFVVMFVAAGLARMCPLAGRDLGSDRSWFRRVWGVVWPLLWVAAVLGGVVVYGRVRAGSGRLEPGPCIALIQGSIDVEMRHDPTMRDRIFKEYYELSRAAVEQNEKLDLVIWPETMFVEPLIVADRDAVRPADFRGDDAEFHRQLGEIEKSQRERTSAMARTARVLGVSVLLGVDTNWVRADGVRCFNSAAYVARDGRLLGRYDKMHLVMFGEYVPFADRITWLQGLTPLPVSATAGERPAAFEVGGSKVRVSPNICYESVLSHVIRGQVNALTAEGREPDVLINLTNDGWFWGSSELDLHLICGVFRAVECRKPFLIAANTGFSAWIDGNGRIVEQGPRRKTAVLIARPEIDRRGSWYLAHGDWFAGVCLGACVLFGGVGIWGRKRGICGSAC